MTKPAKKRLCSENSIYCCGTSVITKLYRAWDVRNNVGKVTETSNTQGEKVGSSSNKSDTTAR